MPRDVAEIGVLPAGLRIDDHRRRSPRIQKGACLDALDVEVVFNRSGPLITKVTLPEGTTGGDNVNPNSNSDTCTVPPGPGFVGVAVVVLIVAVVRGGLTTARTPPSIGRGMSGDDAHVGVATLLREDDSERRGFAWSD